jgi:arginine N-succinyltransferase
LVKLAQIPGFINLPKDRDQLSAIIERSKASFAGTISDPKKSKFVFVAEDVENQRVVGTSMVASQHGTPESPHFFFEVGTEEKFSTTINTGFIHGTLKLKYDTNGPSEIGGLVIDPEYRNSPSRIGRQISFVRFLYIALNRSKFKNKILAELLPPLNKEGRSPLWEAIGRRFTNMDYWEADRLCCENKEFIFSLFPTGKIYTTFLPAEARHAIGKVGKSTEPVLHMLQKIGFKYLNQVDPFDGGPHLWGETSKLIPIKKMHTGSIEFVDGPLNSKEEGLLTIVDEKKPFRAFHVSIQRKDKKILVPSQAKQDVIFSLGLTQEDLNKNFAFAPYYG